MRSMKWSMIVLLDLTAVNQTNELWSVMDIGALPSPLQLPKSCGGDGSESTGHHLHECQDDTWSSRVSRTLELWRVDCLRPMD